MSSLHIHHSNAAPIKAFECVRSPELDGGPVAARFLDIPNEELSTLRLASREGKLYTYAPGQRYDVAELEADGYCRLVPTH